MIAVEHLRKTYGPVVAVDDVSLAVEPGEIFGILGPNGAGKTTTVECVTGLRAPDSGTVRVLGVDPRTDRARIQEKVGVQLQESALPPRLRVGEALELYGSFYRAPADTSELVRVLGLTGKERAPFGALSGGQKQRLFIALALIGRPEVAVLDELTSGLDPQARRDTWEFIETVRSRGVTVVLVTHIMEEAERLCDRVALIDRGRVVAADTPAALAARSGGGSHLWFHPSGEFEEGLLRRLASVEAVERRRGEVVVRGNGDVVVDVVRELETAGVRARDLRVRTASLEDAFLSLTGHGFEEGERS